MSTAEQWWSARPGRPDYDIFHSLRFRGNQYLERVRPSLPPTDVEFTFSLWIKFSTIGNIYYPFSLGNNVGPSSHGPMFQVGGLGEKQNEIVTYDNRFNNNGLAIDGRFRDFSAWYHFVWQSSAATGSRIYVNGELRQTRNQIPEGSELWQVIGTTKNINGDLVLPYQGYISDVKYIEGLAPEPTEFGEIDENGVWVGKEYAGNYGTQGFFLDFETPEAIGKDKSGNDNDFTPHGFELADQTSVLWDHMEDNPYDNIPTWNLISSTVSAPLINANVGVPADADECVNSGSIGLNEGKWYWEINSTGSGEFLPYIGVTAYSTENGINEDPQWGVGNRSMYETSKTGGYVTKDYTGSIVNYGSGGASPTGVYALTLDFDAGELKYYRDNTLIYTDTTIPTDGTILWPLVLLTGHGGLYWTETNVNYGQRPFAFEPPAGFKSLQTLNMRVATVPNGRDHFRAITGAGTGADATYDPATNLGGNWTPSISAPGGFLAGYEPSRLFDGNISTDCFSADPSDIITFEPTSDLSYTSDVSVYSAYTLQQARVNGGPWVTLNQHAYTSITTGSGVLNTVEVQATSGATAFNAIQVDGKVLVDLSVLSQAQQVFPSGLWWIKDRENSNTQGMILDSIRGTSAANSARFMPNGDGPNAPWSAGAYTPPTGNSVAWCWNFNDADPSINGFEMISYTGNYDQNAHTGPADRPITHRLGKIPAMIWTSQYNTDDADMIAVWIHGMSYKDRVFLDSDIALINAYTTISSPTDTTFYVGPGGTSNKIDRDYIAYVWSEIPGYSSFGQYTGNGDVGVWPPMDTPFIYTGFRPAWVIVKNTRYGDWEIADSTRDTYNPCNLRLRSNTTEAESVNQMVDFCSNGFKIRAQSNQWNGDGDTIVYAAFAENPFTGQNVFPANAR